MSHPSPTDQPKPDQEVSTGSLEPPEAMQKLRGLLRDAFGQDLADHKQSTIDRRVERRMKAHKIERLDEYLRFVQGQRGELETLHRDLLVHATGFFREGAAFEVLGRVVLPRLLGRRAARETLRIWVPGCSSGEEAYSIAICVLEALGARAYDVPVQIFGTDVDADAIERARHGRYARNIEQDVSAERLDRFFEPDESGYRIRRRVRDLVVFSTQDVTKDAPLSRMDLVSCRNVAVNMQAPLQKRLLAALHYALKPDGYLLLGASETVGDAADRFTAADGKAKLYTKKARATARHLPAPHLPRGADLSTPAPMTRSAVERRPVVTAQQLADRKLLDEYAPPSVLVNDDLDVLLFRGNTAPYFSPASGPATLNLMRLARPELHVDLFRALEDARKNAEPARRPPVVLETKQDDRVSRRAVAIEAAPLAVPDTQGSCWLIVFHELARPALSDGEGGANAPVAVRPDDRFRAVEHELVQTKAFLQGTIEELESSNEELRSTNEELHSANEELQSTNEELETSQEELQSSNQELSSVNDELRHRLADLSRRDGDLLHLLRSIRDPVLFVDRDLRLRSYGDVAAALFDLMPEDVGRGIGFLQPVLGGFDVERLLARGIERIEPLTEDVLARDGRWYSLTARPHAAPHGAVDGALVTLVDVDATHRGAQVMLDVAAYGDKLLAAIGHPLAILDVRHRVLWANAAFFAAFRVSAAGTLGNLFHNLGSGQWAHPNLRELIDGTLQEGKPFDGFVIEHDFEFIGKRAVKVSGRRVRDLGGVADVALVSLVDVSPGTGGTP